MTETLINWIEISALGRLLADQHDLARRKFRMIINTQCRIKPSTAYLKLLTKSLFIIAECN